MNQIAMLLPVRIETRFKPGRLLVRIVPDEPWFTRHDERVSKVELEVLGRYLRMTSDADDDERLPQAWDHFVDQVGGARAVHLVRHWTTTNQEGDPAVRSPESGQVRTDPAFPRIEGFPEKLTVWLVRGGEDPVAALTLTVDRARLLADFPDPDDPGDHRWWEDWQEAVTAGLAGEMALDGEPEDIEALYVTGLGDGDPAKLFRTLAADGRLGVLPPGAATNTVQGAPAASLATDPATWWEVLQSAAGEADRTISLALTGDPEALGHLPGAGDRHQRWNHCMVSGLWPALWGFAAQDVWSLPVQADDAPFWAEHALYPEGPFPTIRVGEQPYGLLPASALSRWVSAPGDPPVELGLLKPLLHLRESYRDAAEQRGTVNGATTGHLLDLVGQVPTSPQFWHRTAWPLEHWWYLMLLTGFRPSWENLDSAWRRRYELAEQLGVAPVRRYGTVSAAQQLDLPLVVPGTLPPDQTVGQALHTLVQNARDYPTVYAQTEVVDEKVLKFSPDSLLLRLAIRSLQLAIGDCGRTLLGEAPPGPEPVARPADEPGRLETWIHNTTSAALHDGSPEAERFELVCESLESLAELVDAAPDRAGRLLSATVDTAAFRIDPWLVGLPTRRLQQLRDDGAPAVVGAYGWVDSPRPGSPGPTAGGLIHAPSPGQALTATILRDRAVNDSSDHRWDLKQNSRNVRGAQTVAQLVMAGMHPGEALGREVERIVTTPEVKDRLRHDSPLRTEHAGRRVCDGLAVLKSDLKSLGVSEETVNELRDLHATLDTYSDLLTAEAVHHAAHGRADVAGATMDAAAGLSRPPQLALLRTPREGRAAATSVLLVLPNVAAPEDPTTDLEGALLSPALLVDSAAATWLHQQIGGPSEWIFEVSAVDEKGNTTGPTASVSLAELGLLPADALALSLSDLSRLAAQHSAASLGQDEKLLVVDDRHVARKYEAAIRLVALIGRRPATPDAVADRADDDVDLRPMKADLLNRYTRARATASLLMVQLDAQLDLLDPDGSLGTADLTILTTLVVAARAWGIAPDPVLPPGIEPSAQQEHRLTASAARSRELLAVRLEHTPSTQTPRDGGPSEAALRDQDALTDALAALVSATGNVALTARVRQDQLPVLAEEPSLATDWLPTLSAVRETVARIDVHRLLATTTATASDGALKLWTNKPGDLWQKDPADSRSLVVACTDPSVDLRAPTEETMLAVAVIDRFVEIIPSEAHTTGAAFGFEAPAARAPQAILLAVPPALDERWDDRAVVDVVADVRVLARARMARPSDLGDEARGLLPTSLLPATGATATPLTTSTRS